MDINFAQTSGLLYYWDTYVKAQRTPYRQSWRTQGQSPLQAKIELKMNLSLLEMRKGNTSIEDLANLKEEWVDPLRELIKELEVTPANHNRS